MRARYGRGPLHLAGHLVFFALAGYAFAQIAGIANAWRVVAWLVGAVVLHDFVLWPLYTAADRVAPHVLRVPAVLSLVVALAFLPMLGERGEGAYRRVSGLEWSGYLQRWLVLTAVLFAVTGLVALARRSARRRHPSP